MIADRVSTTVTAGGTGTITLGAAVPGYRTFTAAFAGAVTSVDYMIIDGLAWETGSAIYTKAANTLSSRTMSASSTGSLINFTNSAIASVSYLSRGHVQDWPVLVVGRESVGNGNFFDQTNNQFKTFGFDANNAGAAWPATTDTHGGWNATTRNCWTVPVGQDGLYDCQAKIRFIDATAAGHSYGVGIDIANQDSPAFQWQNTLNNRQGGYNSRLMPLLAGQQLRAFCYYDNSGISASVVAASFVVQRVR